jgi:hypothetical protein
MRPQSRTTEMTALIRIIEDSLSLHSQHLTLAGTDWTIQLKKPFLVGIGIGLAAAVDSARCRTSSS